MIDATPSHVSLTWEKYQRLLLYMEEVEDQNRQIAVECNAWESEVHQACDLLGVPKGQRLPGASGLMESLTRLVRRDAEFRRRLAQTILDPDVDDPAGIPSPERSMSRPSTMPICTLRHLRLRWIRTIALAAA